MLALSIEALSFMFYHMDKILFVFAFVPSAYLAYTSKDRDHLFASIFLFLITIPAATVSLSPASMFVSHAFLMAVVWKLHYGAAGMRVLYLLGLMVVADVAASVWYGGVDHNEMSSGELARMLFPYHSALNVIYIIQCLVVGIGSVLRIKRGREDDTNSDVSSLSARDTHGHLEAGRG